MIQKLLLFRIGVMKLVDMFPLGWNGLNTMQVQILSPINIIYWVYSRLVNSVYKNYIYVVD